MAIRESLLDALNSIATSDFVRSVTYAGASSKVTVSNLAKTIIENYTGSTLAGSSQSIKSAIDASGVVVVSKTGFSTLPTTITDSSILSTHVCVKAELSKPSEMVGDWTVTTSSGSAVISGTKKSSAATSVTLYLAPETN